MVIAYSLKNTGSKVIDTTQFNHNFFVMDGQTTGPGVVARFQFEPRALNDFAGVAEVRSKEIVFLKKLEGQQRVYVNLDGYGSTASDYKIAVENRNAGIGVAITGDKPLAKLIFWSRSRVVGPEPYIHLRIDPGKTENWENRYRFYTLDEEYFKGGKTRKK